MERLFRLPSAVLRAPEIGAWFAARPAALGALGRPWFEAMRGCGDDVRALLHDGHPTACVGDAAFGYVNIFRAHVNIGFFGGAELPDPARLLSGTGKFMRHVKLRPGEAVDEGALRALVQTAYDHMRRLAQGT